MSEHRTSAELEQDVEAQRRQVENTLETIQEQLSPGELFENAMGYFREAGGVEFGRNLGRAVRDNPLPVALVGVGIAWLMASGARANGHRTYYSSLADDLGDDGLGFEGDYPGWTADDDPNWPAKSYGMETHMSNETYGGSRTGSAGQHDSNGDSKGLTDRASEVAHDLRSKAMNVGGQIQDRASSALHDTGEAARHYAHAAERQARRYGRRARRTFVQTLQEQPLVLGALGLALGVALGAALPATRREDEWMGETRDDLRDQAMQTARDSVGRVRGVAEAAYGAAREEAAEQGITGEAAREAGNSVAEKLSKVAEAARNSAEREVERT